MTYNNVLVLLNRLGYVQAPSEQELFRNNQMESLKRAYQFWGYVATKGTATLENFFVMVCAIEKIGVGVGEITKAVALFVNYLCRRSVSFKMGTPEQPEYRFIVHKPSLAFGAEGEIILDRASLIKIPSEFKIFLVNRLNSQLEKTLVADRP